MWRIRHKPLTVGMLLKLALEVVFGGLPPDTPVGVFLETDTTGKWTPAKRCGKCHRAKRREFDFYRDRTRPDGREWQCSDCRNGAED